MPVKPHKQRQGILAQHSSKTLKHIQRTSDDVCLSLQGVAHQQTKYTVGTIQDEHEKTRECVQQHTFEVKMQNVKAAKDVGITMEAVKRDLTTVIIDLLEKHEMKVNKNYNKLVELLSLIWGRLNCFSDSNCGSDDSSDIVSTRELENGNVAVIFKTGNRRADSYTVNSSDVNKLNSRNIEKFTMPCMHAMDPQCLKNFCRSRMNAGQCRFVCPKEGCDVEWRYEVVRQYCSLTKNEATEFETTLSINYAHKAFGGVMQCPGCKSWCARSNPKDKEVQCPHCWKVFKFKSKVSYEE